MTQIDLFLPNIAIGAISVAVAALAISFMLAIMLHSIYDLGLRAHLNSEWLHYILRSTKESWSDTYRLESVEKLHYQYGINRQDIIEKVIQRLESNSSLLSLPTTQLTGQISIVLDELLTETFLERIRPDYRDNDDNYNFFYQSVKASYESWLDAVQIRLSERWQRIDFIASAILAIAMVLVFLSASLSWAWMVAILIISVMIIVISINYSKSLETALLAMFAMIIFLSLLSGALSWILVSFVIPILIVPQARIIVERILRSR